MLTGCTAFTSRRSHSRGGGKGATTLQRIARSGPSVRHRLPLRALSRMVTGMNIPYLTALSPDQQRDLGLAAPQPLAMADRVRYSELDVLNHVNNGSYMEWFERLRVRYGQVWGLSPDADASKGPRTVIRSGQIHYRQEMHADETYVATCGCTAFRNTSYTLHQEIWAAGTLRATFDCVMVLLNPDGPGRMPIPQAVRERFGAVDGAAPEG